MSRDAQGRPNEWSNFRIQNVKELRFYSFIATEVRSVILEGGLKFPVLDVVTPFEVITIYDTPLEVINGNVRLIPDEAGEVIILDQKIPLYSRSLTYEKDDSGRLYLSSFKIDQEIKLKAARGFRKMKTCKRYSEVKLNPEGLVIGCM